MSQATFALNLPSKSDKELYQLTDGVRIMLWTQFKSDYKDLVGKDKQFANNKELHDQFYEVWSSSEIKQYDLAQVKAYISGLGYSINDVYTARKEYYDAKRNFFANKSEETIPF